MNIKTVIFTFFAFLSAQAYSQIAFQQHNVIDESFGVIDPIDIIAVDIDQDGFNDIVSTSYGELVWFKNLNASGNFSKKKQIVPSFTRYNAVKAGDLDGDTDKDLVYYVRGNSGESLLYWSENTDGLGTFGTPTQLITIQSDIRLNIQVIDMDNDSDLDIAYSTSTYAAWFENTDGLGTFTNHDLFGSSTDNNAGGYADFLVLDVDNDNRPDIFRDMGYSLEWFKNNANGTLSYMGDISTFSQTDFITGEDIDNDGDNDVLMIFENGGNNRKIYWFENTDGQGNFASEQTLLTLPSAQSTSNFDVNSLILKDLNNDGNIDILYSESRVNKVSWYINNGNLSFGTEQAITNNAKNVRSIFAIDLDGDADLDVISSSRDDHKIAWYENTNGLGNYSTENAISTVAYFVNHADSGDLDGDGDIDLVSSSHADNKIAWYENINGLGGFSEQIIVSNNILDATDAFIVDMDNDADMDIFAFSFLDDTDSSEILWFENDGSGNFTKNSITTIPNEEILHIAHADIDGDNDTDIVSGAKDNILSVYKNNGDGTFATRQIFSTTSTIYLLDLQVADIDGDNDVDVLASYNNDEIAWYENTNGQGDYSSKHIVVNQMHYPAALYVADLDGDNDKDVLFANQYHNEIGYFLNTDGQGNFGPKVVAYNILNPTSIFAMDLDGDGDEDMLSNSGDYAEFFWFENDGTANFIDQITISSQLTMVREITSADVNQDGKLDLVVGSQVGTVAWFENLGTFNNTIFGIVKLDADANGCDPNDAPISNLLITTTTGTNSFSTFTQSDGSYKFLANQDSFTTSLSAALPNYYGSNPANHTSNFSGMTSTNIQADFCVESSQNINDISISVYPALNDPRPGFDTNYTLVYKNNGTVPISGNITFEYDDTKLTIISTSQPLSAQTNNTLTFDYSNLNPFETRYITVFCNVFTPPTTNINEILNFKATITPASGDATPQDNVFEFEQTVVGSYDPNDIRVVEGDQILLADSDEYLHYIIRFQNTGTAEAINIKVKNILDDKLDWNTLQLERLSHPGKVNITNGNEVLFVFNNIYLPDMNTDEPNSHGYIAYKIKPKNNVAIGDIFHNSAEIFFDFNTAIITNTVSTEIVMDMSIYKMDHLTFSIYPVPSTHSLTIESVLGFNQMIIYDIQGRRLKTIKIPENQLEHTINIEKLSAGIYFLKIVSGNNKYIKRFIKE